MRPKVDDSFPSRHVDFWTLKLKFMFFFLSSWSRTARRATWASRTSNSLCWCTFRTLSYSPDSSTRLTWTNGLLVRTSTPFRYRPSPATALPRKFSKKINSRQPSRRRRRNHKELLDGNKGETCSCWLYSLYQKKKKKNVDYGYPIWLDKNNNKKRKEFHIPINFSVYIFQLYNIFFFSGGSFFWCASS